MSPLFVILLVPVFAFRNVFRGVTALDVLVVHQASITLSRARIDTVQAVVESRAVTGMGIVGVGDNLAVLVRAGLLGAHEAIVEFLVAVAATSNASGNIGPGTVSGPLIKVQSSHAVHLQLFAVDAVVEDVAHRWIGMGEESILARAELGSSLGLLKFQSVSAVNIEGLVALVHELDRRIEHQTVGAQLLRGHTFIAFVVLVALNRIRELASILGTFELCI